LYPYRALRLINLNCAFYFALSADTAKIDARVAAASETSSRVLAPGRLNLISYQLPLTRRRYMRWDWQAQVTSPFEAPNPNPATLERYVILASGEELNVHPPRKIDAERRDSAAGSGDNGGSLPHRDHP